QARREGLPLPARRDGDQCPACAAGHAALPALDREWRDSRRDGERGERVPARDCGREDLAEGFSHAECFSCGLGSPRAYRACVERTRTPPPGEGSCDCGFGRAFKYARDLPQELCAPDRGGGVREREAGEVFRSAEGPPFADASREIAGAGG